MQPRLFCGHSVCFAHVLSAFEAGLDIPVPFLHSLSYVEDPPQEEKRVFRRFQRARARTRPKSDFLSISIFLIHIYALFAMLVSQQEKAR